MRRYIDNCGRVVRIPTHAVDKTQRYKKIKSEYQKLDIYKRIAAIESEEELSDMKDELVDRYGSLSTPAVNLLNIALIKSMAHKIGIMEMKGTIEDGPSGCYKTVMKVYPKAEINTEAIPDFIDSFGGAMKLVSGSQPQFIWRVTKKKYNNAGEYLTGIKEMLKLMQNKLQL